MKRQNNSAQTQAENKPREEVEDDASPPLWHWICWWAFLLCQQSYINELQKKKKKMWSSETSHIQLPCAMWWMPSSKAPCCAMIAFFFSFFPYGKKWKDNWAALDKDTHWAMWGLLHSICMLYGNIRVGGQHVPPTRSTSSWRLEKIRALLFDDPGMRLNSQLRYKLDF